MAAELAARPRPGGRARSAAPPTTPPPPLRPTGALGRRRGAAPRRAYESAMDDRAGGRNHVGDPGVPPGRGTPRPRGGHDADAARTAVDRAGTLRLAALDVHREPRGPVLAAELQRAEGERENRRDRAPAETSAERRSAERRTPHRPPDRPDTDPPPRHRLTARHRLNRRPRTRDAVSSRRPPHPGECTGQTGREAPGCSPRPRKSWRRLEASAARERSSPRRRPGCGARSTGSLEQARRVTARLASGRTRREELSADAERLGARLDEARGEDATMTARLDRLADEAELLREALEAARRRPRPRASAARRGGGREAAWSRPGSSRLGGGREAAAPAEREEQGRGRLRELDAEGAAVAAMLADPELVAAAAEPEPDLAGLSDGAGRGRAPPTPACVRAGPGRGPRGPAGRAPRRADRRQASDGGPPTSGTGWPSGWQP